MISLDLMYAGGGGVCDFDALRKKFLARGQGWLDCLDDSTEEWKKLAVDRAGDFDRVVVLGIGGSALGARMIADFFGNEKLQVLDTIDPNEVDRVWAAGDPNRTLWVAISKSGTTLETRELLNFVAKKVSRSQIVLISEPGSQLHEWGSCAQSTNIDQRTDVGGRYSVLTSVGMVPAACAGISVDDILDGAREMRDDFLNSESPLAGQLAAAIFSANREALVHLPYCTALRTFGQWWVQLVSESLGKKGLGYTPICGVGPTDQHSFLQLLAEGPDHFSTVFVRDASIVSDRLGKIMNVELAATAQSLAELKRPNVIIDIPDRSAQTLGQLIVLWECTVAMLGEMLEIDAFDQPGVERGKVITRELLEDLE